jgi:hypothetical protein
VTVFGGPSRLVFGKGEADAPAVAEVEDAEGDGADEVTGPEQAAAASASRLAAAIP